MATLYVRNVPDELKATLEEVAKEHRSSVNREVLAALERGMQMPRQSRAEVVAEIKARRGKAKPGTDFAAIIREGREEREHDLWPD